MVKAEEAKLAKLDVRYEDESKKIAQLLEPFKESIKYKQDEGFVLKKGYGRICNVCNIF